MRCFIAVDIPEMVKKEVMRATERARKSHRDLKWVEEENLHITLKFLGEVEREKIEKVKRVLDMITRAEAPFNLTTSEFGTFPKRGALRVFWLGIEGDLDEIKKLQERIEKELLKIGFDREDREFTPHLTLARAKRYSRERVTLDDLDLNEVKGKSFRINEVVLYESILRPEGPLYKKISVFKLRGR